MQNDAIAVREASSFWSCVLKCPPLKHHYTSSVSSVINWLH